MSYTKSREGTQRSSLEMMGAGEELSEAAKTFINQYPHLVEVVNLFESQFDTMEDFIIYLTDVTPSYSIDLEGYGDDDGWSGDISSVGYPEVTEMSYSLSGDETIKLTISMRVEAEGTLFKMRGTIPEYGYPRWYEPDDYDEWEVEGNFTATTDVIIPFSMTSVEDCKWPGDSSTRFVPGSNDIFWEFEED